MAGAPGLEPGLPGTRNQCVANYTTRHHLKFSAYYTKRPFFCQWQNDFQLTIFHKFSIIYPLKKFKAMESWQSG